MSNPCAISPRYISCTSKLRPAAIRHREEAMANSMDSAVLRDLYLDWTNRMVADPNLSIANLRSMFDEWGQPTLVPENV